MVDRALTLIAIEMVNGVFALRTAKFSGLMNFELGMLAELAMIPMGAALHDPPLTCWPLVRGKLGTVAQKLM